MPTISLVRRPWEGCDGPESWSGRSPATPACLCVTEVLPTLLHFATLFPTHPPRVHTYRPRRRLRGGISASGNGSNEVKAGLHPAGSGRRKSSERAWTRAAPPASGRTRPVSGCKEGCRSSPGRSYTGSRESRAAESECVRRSPCHDCSSGSQSMVQSGSAPSLGVSSFFRSGARDKSPATARSPSDRFSVS